MIRIYNLSSVIYLLTVSKNQVMARHGMNMLRTSLQWYMNNILLFFTGANQNGIN